MREGMTVRDRSTVQTLAMLMGAVFLLVGILGFIPGITTHYGRLTKFGDTGAKLLGIFGINIVENIIHLLYGVAGFAMARTWEGARTFLIGGGVIYLVVWIYGLVVNGNNGGNIIGINTPANWLHFVLGIAMIGLGLITGRARRDRPVMA